MAGREFEREEVAKLLTEGRVGPLEGFRSKLGRAFNAEIILNEKTEWKQKFDFDDKDGNGEGANGKALDLSQAKQLGETPARRGLTKRRTPSSACPRSGRQADPHGQDHLPARHPAEQALKIFRDGKSDLLPRFISKKGKPFTAYLKLEGTKVGFEFEPRAKKKPAPKKDSAEKVASSNET